MKNIPSYIFIYLLFTGCYTRTINYKIKEKGIVTIEGEAKNAKLGAIIHTKKDNVYYIENLNSWDEKHLNKIIIVKGKLVKYKYPKQSTEEGQYAEILHQNIIQNPSCVIIKN
jgi:hypothetical protein